MAFPESPTILTEALDVTSENYSSVVAYQTAISDGDFASAQTILQNMTNGVKTLISASRFNEVLDLINEIQTFYINDIYPYIEQNINSAFYEWDSEKSYAINEMVIYGGNWYRGLTASNLGNIPNESPSDWVVLLIPNPPTLYPVQTTEPAGQTIGDLWFEVIEE